MAGVLCSMCGEHADDTRVIVGDSGAICIDCVWMCVDILEERGEKRPEASDFDADETSQVYEKGTIPPPK